MGINYERLHGGLEPNRTSTLRYLVRAKCRPVVELGAISYACDKGEGPETYRHVFSAYLDETGSKRGPYLLEEDGAGEYVAGDPVGDTTALGVLVDLEDASGNALVVSSGDGLPILVATNRTGDRLILCAARGLPYAIEDRPGTFRVSAPEGIVG